jgi:hypothetical protein
MAITLQPSSSPQDVLLLSTNSACSSGEGIHATPQNSVLSFEFNFAFSFNQPAYSMAFEMS